MQHLVKLSQPAADEESPVRFLRYQAAVERRIRELGIEFTFLRPNLYFRGLLALSGPIREQGALPPPNGDARVSAVDVRDIAAVAAVALAETPTRRRHLHHHRPMVSRSASPIRIPVTAITPRQPITAHVTTLADGLRPLTRAYRSGEPMTQGCGSMPWSSTRTSARFVEFG